MTNVDMSFGPSSNVFVTEEPSGFKCQFDQTKDHLTLNLTPATAWELFYGILSAFQNAENSPVIVKINYMNGMDISIRHKEEV